MNVNYLVIVESPNKIKKIQSILGDKYQVVASSGHICTLPSLKHIDVNDAFNCTYELIPTKKDIIHKLRSTIASYAKHRIILATDNDREGEAIAFHICRIFELPIESTKRVVFNEITHDAILQAMAPNHIRTIDMNLVKSQQARQILDVIIGFKLSPLLWKYLYNAKQHSLSAGRCQTPALRLIYDNYLAINNETSYQVYRTVGHFLPPPFTIKATLQHDFVTIEECRTFLHESNTFSHRMELGNASHTYRSPPRPFNTSTVLQYASRYMHISSQVVMTLLQSLYQEGLITYIRTESHKYSHEFIQKAIPFIHTRYSEKHAATSAEQERISNKHDSLPHEAIRVTDIQRNSLQAKNPQLSTLYRIIWNNTITSCMTTAVFLKYDIQISAPQEKQYYTTLHVPVFLGWLEHTKSRSTNNVAPMEPSFHEDGENEEHMKDDSEKIHYLKSLKDGQVSYQWLECHIMEKGANLKHYNESKLIKKLEELEIGRPSTYTKFVETIMDRKYVKCTDTDGYHCSCTDLLLRNGHDIVETTTEKCFGAEKQVLVIQPIGVMCIEFLLKYFHTFFAYDYSKSIEQALDTIQNDSTWYHICQKTFDELNLLIHPISKVEEKRTIPLLSRNHDMDVTYSIAFQSAGPFIQKQQGKKVVEYLPIKQHVKENCFILAKTEVEGVKSSSPLFVEDIAEFMSSIIGEYEGKTIYRKCGPFGYYVEWGDEKKTFPKDKSISELTVVGAIQLFRNDHDEHGSPSTMLRTIDNDTTVRRGQYGLYIFYQPPTFKRPKFIPLKEFQDDPIMCNIETLQAFMEEHKYDKKPRFGNYRGRGKGRGGRGRGRGRG